MPCCCWRGSRATQRCRLGWQVTSGLCRQLPVLLSMLHQCFLLQTLKLGSSLREPNLSCQCPGPATSMAAAADYYCLAVDCHVHMMPHLA